jgi:hypothetical protein
MIDLTNKSTDEINSYIQKYTHALEMLPPLEQPIMAYIINVAMNHIQEKHSNVNGEVKACSIVILKKLQNILNNDDDIKKSLDDFFEYFNNEFKSFAYELYPGVSADAMIYEFMYWFINKKIGN